MKILLTGATGFLGSHILKRLLQENHEVSILIRTSSNQWRIKKYETKYQSYNIDQETLNEIIKKIGNLDVIIHCATMYARDGERCDEVYCTNVEFPLALINAAIKVGCNVFINTDSFFTKSGMKTSKQQYMSDYINSKIIFLEKASDTVKYKMQLINMQLEHIYGEADNKDKFIPDIICKCISNNPELLLSDGEQKRDLIYVTDVVEAYMIVLNHLSQLNQSGWKNIEVGMGISFPVREIVELIRDITDSNTKLCYGAIERKRGECDYSQADIEELRKLGWKPEYNIRQGLEKTCNYYRNINKC